MPKILAVEDNPAILDFYKEFFVESGFEIETAEDALSAITKYQLFKPDVIILDLDIPAGGGMQVFERLRSTFNDPVPIIFSTGKPEKLPRLENLHNASGLPKPVDPEKLLAEVKKLTAGVIKIVPQMNPVPPPPPSPALLQKAASGQPPAAAAVPAKILVVDDDLTLLELYKDFLGSAGFEVQTAEDAIGALTRFQEFKPALVILDVDMPAGGGKKVFERLRIQLASPTPIIFSTGNTESVQALERNLNVVVLKKPLVPATIVEAIRKLLKLS
ncbi:MAG TPA: hypothetical protein DCZ92_03940 [Elusimicrobia bacterium]|nr:MAG: hypothetical protein A2016_01165 [Elusimicrobia bacterium GWF2_62_30]HBA59967.1 hypothetical protein [Elusimicrobiota bacterium]